MDRSRDLTRREIWHRKLLYPAYRWPGIALAVAPVVVASGIALHDGVFAPGPAVLSVLLGWLMQLGGVLASVYQNLREEPEDGEHPALVRAVKTGTLTLASVRAAAGVCFIVVAAGCIYLFFVAGIGVLFFGLTGVVAAWAYSSGPVPLGKAGAGDPLFFTLFGLVAVLGSYYVQAAPAYTGSSLWVIAAEALPWRVLLVAVPVGALATTLLIMDDIRDRDFDALKGKRTIAVRFGIGWSRFELATLMALAYLTLFLVWAMPSFSGWVLLPLLTAPYAVFSTYFVVTGDSYKALIPAKRHLARTMLAFSVLFAIGLAVS